MRSDPSIQKLHLFPGMEPVLPAGHNGQICMMLPCKCRYRFDGCQVIVLAVENTGGNIPDDRVFPHVTKIRPGQRFPELRGDFPLLGKLLFGHIRPLHHLADQVFHKKSPEKFVQFAQRVFQLPRTPDMSDCDYGQAGLDALKAEFRSWGLLTTLRELGVTKEMIPAIVEKVMSSPETYVFDAQEVAQVLTNCL